MRKFKTKLASILVALTCVFACLGVGAFAIQNKAFAENPTTYEITCTLTATGSSDASAIYAYPTDESQKPAFTDGAWAYNFTFVEGTGNGKTINGEQVGGDLKKPGGDFYINFGGVSAAEGDVFAIDGEFHNADANVSFIFRDCKLQWNGSAWVQYVVPTVKYEITCTLTATGSSDASAIYAYPTDESQKPAFTDGAWAYNFTFVEGTGNGKTINGEQVGGDLKKPGGDFYINFGGVSAAEGDVFAIDGEFQNADANVSFIFRDCKLQWNGSAWVQYVETPVVEYEVFTATNAAATGDSNASTLYLYDIDGNLPKERGDWDNRYAFEGTVTLNGEAVAVSEAKFPGDFFLVLGATANSGDVLAINGAFTNDTTCLKLVFDCKLQWNGSAWVQYVEAPVVEYEVFVATNAAATGSSNASTLYIYDIDGNLPKERGDWDNLYAFEGTVTLNGEAVAISEAKFPGDFFLVLGATANSGDVLAINGAFTNDTTCLKLVFDCKLQWNGSAWVQYVEAPVVEYTTYELGELILHVNSTIGAACNKNDALYLQRADGEALPILDWEAEILAESAENFKVNGEVASLAKIRSTGDGFYWEFAQLNAGDYITISGTFVCESKAIKYVIEQSRFEWTGSNWTIYEEPVVVEYDVFTATNAGATGSSNASTLYIYDIDGNLPKERGDWDNLYAFEGTVTLNGEAVAITEAKFPGDLYLVLGAAANSGDVLAINGAFTNDTTCLKLVFDCKLQWNGSAWVQYVEAPVVEYEVFAATNAAATGSSNASTLYIYDIDGNLPKERGDWDNLYAFEGTVTLNGEAVAISEAKFPGDFFLVLGATANSGDVLAINGAFTNDTTCLKLVFDCKLQWNGSAWVQYVPPKEYTTYELGELILHINSTIGAACDKNDTLYLKRTEDKELPFMSWDFLFVAQSDECFKVNGKNAFLAEVKSTDAGFFLLFGVVDVGDYVTVSGTFTCEEQGIIYVIEECSFEWTGNGWIPYVEYTSVELGAVETVSGNAQVVNLHFAEDITLPVISWDYAFNQIDGLGITVDGEMVNLGNNIKSVDNTLYVELNGKAIEGSVLKIGGAFRNIDSAYEYIIEESTFVWNGEAWVKEGAIAYTVTHVGDVEVVDGDSTSLTLVSANGITLPVDGWDYEFVCVSGNGVTVGDLQVDFEFKSFEDQILIALVDGEEIQVGQVVQIGGIFVCEEQNVKYVIEDSAFAWTGEGWEITTKVNKLGALVLHGNSSVGGKSGENTELYLQRADGKVLPILNWDYAFVAESEDCFTVNGSPVTLYEMKSTSDGLFFKFDALSAGDVITVSGRFICEALNVVYEIEESSFEWTGSSWLIYVEYTTYEVGEMYVRDEGSSAEAFYLFRMDGEMLEVNSWDYVFLFKEGSGVGITVNGEVLNTKDIKSPGGAMYIGFNGYAASFGDVITVGGTFRNVDTAVAYVITECSFIYTENGWVSEIDLIKEDAVEELNEKLGTLSQDDYYEEDWSYILSVVSDGEFAINNAISKVEIAEALELALAELDEAITKEESDAMLPESKVNAKAELDAYKSQDDYRNAEWTAICAIVEKAKQDIDACNTVTQINLAVKNAKAEIDLIKTDAELKEDEAYAADAKAELDAYKSAEAYREKEWAEIQDIIAKAKADIDLELGNYEDIDQIVAEAKAAIDLVKVKEEAEADDAFVAGAKAELAAYADSSKYYDAEWAEIQAIIAKAGLAMDEAIGDEAAINQIVAEAKAEIDEVMVKEDVDEANFAKAQDDAKKEVRDYYASLDHSRYDDDAEAELSRLASSAISKIDFAVTEAQIKAAVAEFKAAADAVEQIKQEESESKTESSSGGCMSSIGGGIITCLLPALAIAVARIARKKED